MDAGSIKPRQVGFSPAIGRSLLARLSSKWILLGHLFLAKDCWMRRQHAIRVVFRFGGYETGHTSDGEMGTDGKFPLL